MSTERRTQDRRARAWVEVDAAALRRNLARIREIAGEGVKLLPLVKADAYGVGVEPAVRALEGEDPWGYGVATVPEGQIIRSLGITRSILVLSPAPPGEVVAGVESGLTFCVSEIEAAREVRRAAQAAGREARIHVEVDTGMGRSGFDWRRAREWGPELAALTDGPVRWEGTFTHFHSADAADGTVGEQAERFEGALARLGEGGVTVGPLRHLSNSAGILRRPDLSASLVRPGIFLYGGSAGEGLPVPEDVIAVRSRVVLTREVPAGTTLGYGAEYTAAGPERWATVGIGYGDGLPHGLGNRGHALVNGRRVPVVGRISMDLTVVDITDLPGSAVQVGTEATFVGTDGGERISLEEVARAAGTVNYEVLTRLSPRLPRVWAE